MTRISVKYPIIGAKVVRGRDWNHGNQDGGEGNVGAIKENLEDGWVRVLWENRNRDNYRIGNERRYDLYFATKEEALLQEAMERFPSGCSYLDTDGILRERVNYDCPYWYEKDRIALQYGLGLIYDNGVWATRTDSDNPSLVDQAKKLFTVNTVFSNTNLGFICTDIKIIKAPEFEIRKDEILIKDGGCDKDGGFTIYKDGKWAKIVPVKEERIEVFKGMYVGDIIVSLKSIHGCRKIGDIYKVSEKSRKGNLHYGIGCSDLEKTFRLATPEELKFYSNGGKNIIDMSKKELSPLELCKQMFPVGTVVITKMHEIERKETITEEVYDSIKEYNGGWNGNISSPCLTGWLYKTETQEYAKIINKPINTNQNVNKNEERHSSINRGIKVSRPHIKIPVTTRTGGTGLKSADCKVRLGSNSSYYQKRLSIS